MEEPVQMLRCEADGFDFEAPVGGSLMMALKTTGFDIEASCEGSLICGTCHVRLLDGWGARIPPPGADEQEMLSHLPGVTPESRLSCQIVLTADLDGISVAIARQT